MLPLSRLKITTTAFICFVFLCVILSLLIETKHLFLPLKYEERWIVERSNRLEKKQTTIPKIIHQVWNNDIVPAEFIPSIKSLVRDNPSPEWQYVWWTRESGTKLIKDKYPYLLERFNKEAGLPGHASTMRADMLRILALHEYGGVYFDLDTNSVRPLASFVDNHECSLTQEPAEHIMTQPNNLEFMVTNAAMFCRAHHPFLTQMLLKLTMLTDDCVIPFLCTGPFMVTPLYKQLHISNGDAMMLPEVQSSKLFQDKYDDQATVHVYKKCGSSLKDMPPGLSPYLRKACSEWHERGRENRTISELAYTYHTWFHVYGKKVDESPSNNVFNIIPHAKIYGVNL